MFKNRIRLPLQLHSAQLPSERVVFRKANGQSKTLSVVIRKTYQLETDFMPENWHQRLVIALSHDNIFVEAERYLGDISQDGDYNIEWPEGVLHYPAAKAETKVQVTPFDATNANCSTCEEMSQLSLTDDEATGIYGALQEDQDYTVNTAANDNICCYPAVFSLVSYNTDYLTSCTINPGTGEVSLHTGTGLTSANGLVLATYRVTCPDGSYDEADIIGNIEGSIEGCLAPTGVTVTGFTTTTADISWDDMGVGVVYDYELYAGASPVGSPVYSGSTTANTINFTLLTPGTPYYFQVRTECEAGVSNWIPATFTTSVEEPGDQTCGTYQITYSAPPDEAPIHGIGYADCAGLTQVVLIPNGSTRIVCALENSPGDPYLLSSSNPYVTITYTGPC